MFHRSHMVVLVRPSHWRPFQTRFRQRFIPAEGDSAMGINTVLRGQTIAAVLFLTVVSLGLSATAKASDIVISPAFAASNQTSPPDTTDYEGIFYDGVSTFPPPGISIGTFNFTIPSGEHVTGATIYGTFGDVNIQGTALTDLFVL